MEDTIPGGWVEALIKGLGIEPASFIEGKDEVCPNAESAEQVSLWCVLRVEENPPAHQLKAIVRDYFEAKGYKYNPHNSNDACGILRRPVAVGGYLSIVGTFEDELSYLILSVRSEA